MIIALLKISPMPDKRQAIIEILMSVKTMTIFKPGCISCDIYEEHGDGKILYIERWQAKENMHQHIRSNLYLRILNSMELSSEPPEVSFHEGGETTGIELIQAIRMTSDENGNT
jgi:quinol monooxygenase YgiN